MSFTHPLSEGRGVTSSCRKEVIEGVEMGTLRTCVNVCVSVELEIKTAGWWPFSKHTYTVNFGVQLWPKTLNRFWRKADDLFKFCTLLLTSFLKYSPMISSSLADHTLSNEE